jgi:phytoene dehydrogenase-like protein
MQLLAPSRTHLRRAYGEFVAGRTPAEPPVLVMTFSAIDPSIAPAGRHNVTAWAQWHPYELSTGERWDDIAAREADKIVAQVERAAPGFASSIEHVHVQTPPDLERELGLRRGNVMHVDMGLDSMFSYRPLPELAGYRTPVRGLFLTGASTHPGGGVFGASGRTAARVVMAQRRRWR